MGRAQNGCAGVARESREQVGDCDRIRPVEARGWLVGEQELGTRSEADGQDYLVTKVYSEVFTQYAMLRPAGITAPDAPTARIKVAKTPQGASLPGYTFTQDGSF